MEKIQHRQMFVNGINMHVAEIGSGPPVLFLHGFPELWYSWRHQMLSLSSKGYRAIAPDLRGYGDTDAPPSPASYTAFNIVGDLVGLLDSLNLDKVFLVAHDWGAVMAWYFCLFRPDRIKALVNLSVAFTPRHPSRKPLQAMRHLFGDDYYICRFQQPGEAEEEFARVDTALLIKKFLTSRSPGLYRVAKEIGFGGSPHKVYTLPSWLSEEDVNYYARKFNQKGFTGGLNYYRALDLCQGICTQRWFPQRCAIFAGVSNNGRSSSLYQPRKARGNQRTYLRLHPEVLIRVPGIEHNAHVDQGLDPIRPEQAEVPSNDSAPIMGHQEHLIQAQCIHQAHQAPHYVEGSVAGGALVSPYPRRSGAIAL